MGKIQNVVVRDNYTLGGTYGGGGAGELLFLYSCIIKNSSFLNNTTVARRLGGGALTSTNVHGFGSPVRISQSTVSGNTSTALGGGLYQEGGAIMLDGVTMADNVSSQGGAYGAIRGKDAELYLKNSIVANNTADSSSGDLYTDWEIISDGNNLVRNDPGDYFMQHSTDIEGVDPLLQPLQFYGEGKAIHPLSSLSPAINAGEVGSLTPDQRGRTVYNEIRDIGAFEVGPPVSYLDIDKDGFGDPTNFYGGDNVPAGYVMNALDNCPTIRNEDQRDSDGDGIGDACDDETSTATDNFELTLACDATVGEAFTLIDTMHAGYLFATYTGDTATGPPIPGDTRNRIVYTFEDVVPGSYSLVARLLIPSSRRRQHFSYWVRVNSGEWREWSSIYRGRSWLFHNSSILDGFELVGGTNTIEIAYNYASNPFIGGIVATIQDRHPIGKFRWCRNKSPSVDPTSAPSATHYLAAKCATVGSTYTIETAPTGETYAVYTGTPSYNEPPQGEENRTTFVVPNAIAGTYTIHARIDAPSSSADSYCVRINNGNWQKWANGLQTQGGFAWKQVLSTQFELPAGRNTIDFAYREPGVKLEKVQVAVSTTVPPNEAGGEQFACGGGDDTPPTDEPPGEDPPALSNEFFLNADCAAVGSQFSEQIMDDGHPYIVYQGEYYLSEPPPDLPEHRIRFTVNNAESGDYLLNGLILAPNGGADSYWVRINDGTWIKWGNGLMTTTYDWRQVTGGPYALEEEGSNTIDFAGREPNIELSVLHLTQQNGIAASTDPGGLPLACDGGAGTTPPPTDEPPTDEPPTDEPEPPTALSDVFYLGPECAQVGSQFVTQTASDGAQYLVYRGAASTGAPPADLPENRIRFTIANAVAGDYTLNALILAPNTGADSYWFRVNDGAWIKWWEGLTTTAYAWREVSEGPHTLREGSNTIDFAYREPNVELKLLHLSQDAAAPGSTAPGDLPVDCNGSGGGDTSPPPPPPAAPTNEFWLEAECATVGSAFTTDTDAAASGGNYTVYTGAASMSAPPPDEAGNRVRFTVNNAVAGNYTTYARIIAPDGGSDSFWVRINDGTWIKWASGLSTTVFAWKAVAGGTHTLREGSNTIDFAFREPNVQLDKLYLQIDGTAPNGTGQEAACN